VTVHRFFLAPHQFVADRVIFPSEVSRQIERVLRLRSGDEVIALDGLGNECVVRLDKVSGGATGDTIVRRRNESEPRILLHLYQGVLKSSKLELVLQKGTEVGVSCFVPVQSARSVAAEPGQTRHRRFDTIVREAAEQSGRGLVPKVNAPRLFTEAIREASERGPILIAWEEERSSNLADCPEAPPGSTVSLFIGPEGGFSQSEVTEAREHGARAITFGPRILRAETAGIVGAALVLAKYGEMG
jgi:16S rRNA (uracil1498-N3)-methyltransferase